jgi:hypothetical protein
MITPALDVRPLNRENQSAEVSMLAYLFVLLAIASRFLILKLVPHPWDFTPLAASLLFFGAHGLRRQWWVPVALFAAADVVLNKFYSYPLTWDLFISWAWYAGALYLGTRLRDHSKPIWVMGAALTSSVSFFLISNFGVWAAYNMYPKTLSGLISCYVAGIPFYQHRFVGDLVFTPVFFAIPLLLNLSQSSRRSAGREAA